MRIQKGYMRIRGYKNYKEYGEELERRAGGYKEES